MTLLGAPRCRGYRIRSLPSSEFNWSVSRRKSKADTLVRSASLLRKEHYRRRQYGHDSTPTTPIFSNLMPNASPVPPLPSHAISLTGTPVVRPGRCGYLIMTNTVEQERDTSDVACSMSGNHPTQIGGGQ
jgi:hypothetical protein